MTIVEPEAAPLAALTEDNVQLIRELREQTRQLIEQLDGPVRRIAVGIGACTVEVEWADPHALAPVPLSYPQAHMLTPSPMPAAIPPAAVSPAAVSAQAPTPAPPEVAPAHTVAAPLVGVFFRSPQPGVAPFIEVGDVVEEGQTLAIVEAMKLMNPIVADRPGRVVAIHVADGEFVEYEQPLVDLAD